MYNTIQMKIHPKGPQASRLRQRKFELIRRFHLPDDLLPGSLSLTHRRCGKPTCHCAQQQGHPIWFLTFMSRGKKRVERIPAAWAEFVQRQVQAGRQFQDALRELLTINAELLVLWRQQQAQRKPKAR